MEWLNKKTGKVEDISYSQILQKEQLELDKRIEKRLIFGNYVNIIIVILIVLSIIIAGLVYFNTGTLGYWIRGVVCY